MNSSSPLLLLLWVWSLNVLCAEEVEPGEKGVVNGRCLRVNPGYCVPGEGGGGGGGWYVCRMSTKTLSILLVFLTVNMDYITGWQGQLCDDSKYQHLAGKAL